MAVKLFIRHPSDNEVDSSLLKDNRGLTIAHYAAWSGKPQALEWVGKHYPDLLTFITYEGLFISDYATMSENVEQCNYAISLSSNPTNLYLFNFNYPRSLKLGIMATLAETVASNQIITSLTINYQNEYLEDKDIYLLLYALFNNINITLINTSNNYPLDIHRSSQHTEVLTLLARNQLLQRSYVKPLKKAARDGQIGLIITLLNNLKADYPDIDEPRPSCPTQLIALYTKYWQGISEPSIMFSQSGLSAFLVADEYPDYLRKLVAESLFNALPLLQDPTCDRNVIYRTIIHLLSMHLNNPEVQNIVRACLNALSDSQILFDKPHANQFLNYHQIIKTASAYLSTKKKDNDWVKRCIYLEALIKEVNYSLESTALLLAIPEIRTLLKLEPEDKPILVDALMLSSLGNHIDQPIYTTHKDQATFTEQEAARSIQLLAITKRSRAETTAPKNSNLSLTEQFKLDKEIIIQRIQNLQENDLVDDLHKAVEAAQINYQQWYRGEVGHRGPNGLFSRIRHGNLGQKRAIALSDKIKACSNSLEIKEILKSFLKDPGRRYHRHSFASFLLDELNRIETFQQPYTTKNTVPIYQNPDNTSHTLIPKKRLPI